MLVQKQTTPYIGVFKVSTGEEFITKVTADDMSGVTINKPLQIVNGPQGPQFAPFMVMGDPENIVVQRQSIVATSKPTSDLENQYESITTGIALPKKSGIIS